MVMLIEVGKTYRNREGEKVSIVGRLPHPRLCFRGDDDHGYREDGGFRFSQDDGESEFDLVAEWVEPGPTVVQPAESCVNDDILEAVLNEHNMNVPDELLASPGGYGAHREAMRKALQKVIPLTMHIEGEYRKSLRQMQDALRYVKDHCGVTSDVVERAIAALPVLPPQPVLRAGDVIEGTDPDFGDLVLVPLNQMQDIKDTCGEIVKKCQYPVSEAFLPEKKGLNDFKGDIFCLAEHAQLFAGNWTQRKRKALPTPPKKEGAE